MELMLKQPCVQQVIQKTYTAVNNINTKKVGHEEGFRAGLTRSLMNKSEFRRRRGRKRCKDLIQQKV